MSLTEVDNLVLLFLWMLFMLITVGKLLNPHGLKNVKYYIIKKWMTVATFYAFMGVPGRNILLFLDNCGTHLQYLSFLQNVKLVYYPPGGVVIYSS